MWDTPAIYDVSTLHDIVFMSVSAHSDPGQIFTMLLARCAPGQRWRIVCKYIFDDCKVIFDEGEIVSAPSSEQIPGRGGLIKITIFPENLIIMH